jgi:hypothetical protein
MLARRYHYAKILSPIIFWDPAAHARATRNSFICHYIITILRVVVGHILSKRVLHDDGTIIRFVSF